MDRRSQFADQDGAAEVKVQRNPAGVGSSHGLRIPEPQAARPRGREQRRPWSTNTPLALIEAITAPVAPLIRWPMRRYASFPRTRECCRPRPGPAAAWWYDL